MTLAGAGLFAAHDLDRAERWAHVHDVPGRRFARIISPRQLAVDTGTSPSSCPAGGRWSPPTARRTLEDSWTAQTANVTLRCFDAWTFRTRDDPDDFASIAKRLDPLTATESASCSTSVAFGRARRRRRPGARAIRWPPAGALTLVPAPGEPPNAAAARRRSPTPSARSPARRATAAGGC